MDCDTHSTFGAFAMACLTIGSVLVVLGTAELRDYRLHQKRKKENTAKIFDIEN